MDGANKIGYVIDTNGEILHELYEGDKIARSAQSQYNNDMIVNYRAKEPFVKLFTSNLIDICKELSDKELAFIMCLAPFISYKDGILRHNNKPISIPDICKLLDKNYYTYRKILKGLIDKNILIKINYATYAINPNIFLKGQDISKSIVNEFSKNKKSEKLESHEKS